MFDLTRGTNYGFHALVSLARAGPGQVLHADQLARSLQASPAYLAKVLSRLERSGLVVSHRGRSGGYSLALPPDAISLWQVAAALHQGPAVAFPALPQCGDCPLAPGCPLKHVFQAAGDDVHGRLQALTVGSLARLMDQGSLSGLSPRTGPTERTAPGEAFAGPGFVEGGIWP